MIREIYQFSSGQVYEVLFKDYLGNFVSPKRTNEQNKDKFLVYIINQEAIFNDEKVTITFFKDITFGVLYEQIKAREKL
jgi:hypothetical protein